MKIIITTIILMIGLSLINGIHVLTKMSIFGSINRLCGNDKDASDKLPSCSCINEFAAQGSIFIGKNRNAPDQKFDIKNNSFGDVFDTTYTYLQDPNGLIGTVGKLKIAGLQCVNAVGDVVEAAPIYTYMFYMLFTSAYPQNSDYFLGGLSPWSKSVTGFTWLKNMNQSNAPDVKVRIKINGTWIGSQIKLGDACKMEGTPRSLESNGWYLLNKSVFNGTLGCDAKKDTFQPLPIRTYMPGTLVVNEPLQCGDYVINTQLHPPEEIFGLELNYYFTLQHDRYCARPDV